MDGAERTGGAPGALRVTAVLASPHGSGSTAAAAGAVLEGCREAGALCTLVDLRDGAADGFAAAVEAVEEADAVVFASPVHRATHTSLLASFLEHVERGVKHETRAPLRGKAAAVVMTGAAPEHFLAPEKLRSVLTSFYAVQVLSPSLFLTGTAFGPDRSLTPGAAGTGVLHGRALVDLAAACRAGGSIALLRPLV
ncbi:NAD(P)H-dependent oxidoreductase [Streptomyces sp. SHP 1-2]|uniref:NAD(P)H-dependent oxidoreductase n=1 Tax=Streptomyces sp. SHP 1-2 TaxID=2769489 RepID=UPI00223849FD|nr:NAD(P)H-dependent oxidoreductase [Streptomyces sp. SHP 1-2]MCW5251343.1 NAD(P)H-dependent oxidoreductase [Streptomyces sp. SHP 1-2]